MPPCRNSALQVQPPKVQPQKWRRVQTLGSCGNSILAKIEDALGIKHFDLVSYIYLPGGYSTYKNRDIDISAGQELTVTISTILPGLSVHSKTLVAASTKGDLVTPLTSL